MAWTAPRTWVTSELETASIFNTHVRDNLTYLNVGRLSKTTAKACSNTLTETDLLNGEWTLPALSTNSVVRATLMVDWAGGVSTDGVTMKVKLGGTTIVTGTTVVGNNADVTVIDVVFMNMAATNVQRGMLSTKQGNLGNYDIVGAVATSSPVTCQFTWTWNVNTRTATLQAAYLEVFGVG